MWTCWGWWQRLVATWAEFQHSVLYYATDQCRKRLKACINADSGHSERLLWHCLPDIPVIHHNRFFSEPPTTTHNWLSSEPPTSERTQQTFSQMKKFRNSQLHKLVWWHFQMGWASGLQFTSTKFIKNNQKILYFWRFDLYQRPSSEEAGTRSSSGSWRD